ncbi:uncharacterized protein LOC132050048 isoform X6 [Lycium ferocissimum]|uniref:uncharacterized protein LOC132050048 isoform X6 n=1 Tax=Lycium ferocissimum TaxID=112874 RepID=UPI0028151B25|nr:uncharacterized protein LOC132050048 isoform X6 [Lycium ferocissimum]
MEDPSLKNETFLAVAERYLEENGSDALEKLIADKDYSSNHHAEKIKPTDTSDEAGKLTPNQEYPIQIEKKTTGVQVKEMTVPAEAEEIKLPGIIFSKQVPTEWTCAVCQVTTTSEQNLKSHLNGRKHKAKCEGVKTCKQTAKVKEAHLLQQILICLIMRKSNTKLQHDQSTLLMKQLSPNRSRKQRFQQMPRRLNSQKLIP